MVNLGPYYTIQGRLLIGHKGRVMANHSPKDTGHSTKKCLEPIQFGKNRASLLFSDNRTLLHILPWSVGLLRTFVVCFRRQNLGSPSNGLKMEIVFKRRLTNELLTTYLPSFLLLLMAYATTFFKDFYFEAAVTVNLSILLVTTTLFVRWEIKRYYILWMRYINILLVSWKSFLQHPMSVWWIYGWSSVSLCLSLRSG